MCPVYVGLAGFVSATGHASRSSARLSTQLGHITNVNGEAEGPGRGSVRTVGHDDLNDRQRRLVALLADGRTLAEAAGEVGCSERQARRQLRSLWDAIGARNRVQGMVQLTRIGLVDSATPARSSPATGHMRGGGGGSP